MKIKKSTMWLSLNAALWSWMQENYEKNSKNNKHTYYLQPGELASSTTTQITEQHKQLPKQQLCKRSCMWFYILYTNIHITIHTRVGQKKNLFFDYQYSCLPIRVSEHKVKNYRYFLNHPNAYLHMYIYLH